MVNSGWNRTSHWRSCHDKIGNGRDFFFLVPLSVGFVFVRITKLLTLWASEVSIFFLILFRSCSCCCLTAGVGRDEEVLLVRSFGIRLDGPRMSYLPESVCSCSVVAVWRGPESRPFFLRGSEGFVSVAVRSGPGMKMLSTDILLEEFHILHLVRYLHSKKSTRSIHRSQILENYM